MVGANGNCLHVRIPLLVEISLSNPDSGNADLNERLPAGMK